MGRTVRELLDDLDNDELVHWFAYYAIDPWTEDRADWRTGLMSAVMVNCTTGSKHQPSDFTPKFRPAEPKITAEVDDDALLLQGMKWAGMLGGKLS